MLTLCCSTNGTCRYYSSFPVVKVHDAVGMTNEQTLMVPEQRFHLQQTNTEALI